MLFVDLQEQYMSKLPQCASVKATLFFSETNNRGTVLLPRNCHQDSFKAREEYIF